MAAVATIGDGNAPGDGGGGKLPRDMTDHLNLVDAMEEDKISEEREKGGTEEDKGYSILGENDWPLGKIIHRWTIGCAKWRTDI